MQLISISAVVASYLKTSSRSFKLFWKFIALALVGAMFAQVLITKENLVTTHLLSNFFSLFSYFFIILAIETNPHLSDTPLNKYISGRVPAVFFIVVCFSYFVLLPTEFIGDVEQSYLASMFFHIVITLLIFTRLVVCAIKSRHKFWLSTYSLLSMSALAILLAKINLYTTSSNMMVPALGYFETVLNFIPYLGVILAANVTLNNTTPAITIKKHTNPELYILLLVLCLALMHVLGQELQLPYSTTSYLQSVVIAFWLITASVLIMVITLQKRRYMNKLKQQIHQLDIDKASYLKINKQLNNSLTNSEDKAIVSVSNNAILTTTMTGEILSANPAAVQMLQCLEDELEGELVSHLFCEDDQMHYFFDFQSNVYALQRKDDGISVECRVIRADGTKFPVQAELQWAEREEQPLIVLTFINLTARKLAEAKALELKDKFIANISHEFRTPLTIINGVLDRYLKQNESGEEFKELTTAKRNGLRLVRMVEQLLELSRLADNPKLSISTYRLSTIMAMPNDSFSRLAKQNQLSFSFDIPDNLWLECDAQAFEKILFNLLANAIKYTPPGGSVKVSAYCEDDTIILDVIDNGIGITTASQSKIFERFQRADDLKNQSIFGVGIGLSLVNELVKAHQWRINLVSEYNHGSKFSLSIPLASAKDVELETPLSVSENEVSSLLIEQDNPLNQNSSHSQQVVLVIEDNVDMQSHIKQVIEQQHHCMLAISGELGLSLAQEYIPDLIVCDIMLTGIDGFEVLKQLKDNELTAHIPVILLTARSDLDCRLQGLNLRADEYLSKPFNQQELLTRIDNLIENRKQLQQTYMHKFEQKQIAKRKENSVHNVSLLTEEDKENLSVDDVFLQKLEATVAKMYMEIDLGIDQLANELAMSERQLQRKIKVLLGTTPNNFIKEFRLAKAQELLKNGTQIGIVALDVGFSSQTYFGRCFKESFNCTPKQYQQSNSSNGNKCG
ncbi:response regulator [Thalassotalea nanhaiensis]|uniref:histidine kinase n=1 Tax=Thalassotalea nanhaiensis TaxID=3065648 RepID=A0ABY9TLU7_9GAMM|nr:response regulator [Colwelliaceae bacterium SQ345]